VQVLETGLKDALEYAELADMEGDEALLEDARAQLKDLKDRAGRAELEALLSGEADGNDCYVEINSGAGGTESCDWAGMLLRMYSRWANAHKMSVELVEETSGDQVGIKSATLLVKGDERLWLAEDRGRRAPPGAHQPLRRRRQAPHVLRLGLGLSGGRRHDRDRDQSVRRADRHLSGLRGRRSAHQQDRLGRAPDAHPDRHRRGLPGRALAAPEPRGSLEDAARPALRGRTAKREAAQQALEDQKTDIGWGHQIRSYVLQPYQMVKDLRTNVETSDTQGVLDGDLDAFMGASLAQRVGATRDAQASFR
jgi:peptide chain release factor 2